MSDDETMRGAVILNDFAVLRVYEDPVGRIYCYVLQKGRVPDPAWATNNYIQWNEKWEKYALYRYQAHRPFGSRVGVVVPVGDSAIGVVPSHHRVGAMPSFEQAVDWLLGKVPKP